MRDMHSNISVLSAIAPQAVSTTGAANGRLSGIIDRQGYESVEFVDAGRGAGVILRFDVVVGNRCRFTKRLSKSGRCLPIGSRPKPFLDERVPLAAFGALPEPFTRLPAAVLTGPNCRRLFSHRVVKERIPQPEPIREAI